MCVGRGYGNPLFLPPNFAVIKTKQNKTKNKVFLKNLDSPSNFIYNRKVGIGILARCRPLASLNNCQLKMLTMCFLIKGMKRPLQAI